MHSRAQAKGREKKWGVKKASTSKICTRRANFSDVAQLVQSVVPKKRIVPHAWILVPIYLSEHRYDLFAESNNTLMSFLVKLKNTERRRDWQLSQFRQTGACLRSSGCSRRRLERAFSSLGSSEATSLACATTMWGRRGTMTDRWHTTRRWQRLCRNCK